MVGRQPTPTKSEQRRYRALKELGCIACRINGNYGVPAEIYHLVEGNKRLGNDYTIPLCGFHHRGAAENSIERLKGPSLAINKRAFVEEYGSERELLAVVNHLLEHGF